MSRTKSTNSETETEETTLIVEETSEVETAQETVPETESKTVMEAVIEKVPKTKGTSTMANTTGKMGVARYLQKYPQTTYVSALLKALYPKAVMTKDEWDQCVEDLLNTKIYN